jgi:hypothetical protein
MPFSQDQVEWLLANRIKLFRYAFIPQLLVAVVFLGFSYRTGKDFVHLFRQGTRTHGKIVGFQPVLIQTHRNPSSTGSLGRTIYLPIVEFRAQDRVVRFTERKLVRTGEGIGWVAPVLYDPSDLSIAMVDRASWNWLPWAPCFAIGCVLVLAALKGVGNFLLRAEPEPNSSSSFPA